MYQIGFALLLVAIEAVSIAASCLARLGAQYQCTREIFSPHTILVASVPGLGIVIKWQKIKKWFGVL